MKKFLVAMSLVLAPLASNAASQPLVGSEWARQNPGLLPFEVSHIDAVLERYIL